MLLNLIYFTNSKGLKQILSINARSFLSYLLYSCLILLPILSNCLISVHVRQTAMSKHPSGINLQCNLDDQFIFCENTDTGWLLSIVSCAVPFVPAGTPGAVRSAVVLKLLNLTKQLKDISDSGSLARNIL